MGYAVLTKTRRTGYVSVFRYSSLTRLLAALPDLLQYREIVNVSREITTLAPLGGLARIALQKAGFKLNEKDGIEP